MSFSADAKRELAAVDTQKICCQRAECYGLFLFAKAFSFQEIALVTESAPVARVAAQLAAELCGCMADISSALVHRGREWLSFTVTIPGRDQRAEMMHLFAQPLNAINLRLQMDMLEKPCCERSFLRGAFLSCGTVTNPKKDYRLEFTVPFMKLANDLQQVLAGLDGIALQPGIANRKGNFVVYLNGSGNVEDLLTFMGAQNASMEVMQEKMLKEVRNNVNRRTNFETANLDKTASASARQLLAIQAVIAGPKGWEAFPEELRELAWLRYQNPEMTLRELEGRLTERVSRSGIHRRFHKILEMAEALEHKKE